MIAGSASAEPVHFVTSPGHYEIEWTPTAQTLEIESGGEARIYDVTGCVFGRAKSGVFAVYFPGVTAPHVAQHCQTESGDRLSIYAPSEDPSHPVFEIYADEVDYMLRPDGISVRTVEKGRAEDLDWRPSGTASVVAKDVLQERLLPKPLKPRQLGLARLDRALKDADQRAALVGDAAGWSGWQDLLRGGWVLERLPDGRQRAFLPAEIANWPRDLDPRTHVFGHRPGAMLRAAPHLSAPLLAPIHRRILAKAPALRNAEALTASGWIHVCAGTVGCGFASLEDVRTPGGAWAAFSREGPEGDWTLDRLQRD